MFDLFQKKKRLEIHGMYRHPKISLTFRSQIFSENGVLVANFQQQFFLLLFLFYLICVRTMCVGSVVRFMKIQGNEVGSPVEEQNV